MEPLYGGLELGGTHCVCAVAQRPPALLESTEFATTSPGETLGRAVAFFKPYTKRLRAVGIGSFGPLRCLAGDSRFGSIAATPKPGWAQTDLVTPFQQALGIPVIVDTDVNTAALAEYSWGTAQGLDAFLYLTVGTGIGGGAMLHGRILHGLLHPEMGHMRIPHDWQSDPFPGHCPYHGDCLEGLASGAALEKRWGRAGARLPQRHPAWSLEAHYLALGLATLICVLSPQRIIMGGGVMQQAHLLTMIHSATRTVLNDYMQMPSLLHAIDAYIVPPALGDRAGVLGALALAQQTHVL